MDRKVIVLLLLAVIASGCGDPPEKHGIAVNELDVTPSTIREGNSASISLEVVNAGLMKGKVFPRENGTRVLRNYCPDFFNIVDYSASSSRGMNQENFKLARGDRLMMHWRLRQRGRVPLPGYTCNLRFEIPFNYSVRAFKQIQVKKNRNVKTAELVTKTSAGPLGIEMKVIGSTAQHKDVILKGENASLYITVYNKGSKEDSPFLGLIRMSSLNVTTSGSDRIEIGNKCGESGTAELSAGNQKIYRCNIKPVNDLGGKLSIRGEISAQVNYTYIRDLGSRQIKVKHGG